MTKKINHRLFWALFFLGLCPTIYTTVRVFFLGTLPGEWSYSIAGQLSWVNLLYEIIQEAIILPLFFFVGKAMEDKKGLTNRVRSGLIVSGAIYAVMSLFIIVFVRELLDFMMASPEIINESAIYIRIESIANIFSILYQFALVVLVALGKSKYVYEITVAKVILSVISDTFLVSTLPISANLGVNGIGWSNIFVNLLLFAVAVVILRREGIDIFAKEKISFAWMRDFLRIGGISGLESFVRNIAYMLMIARMVNAVNEQGTYWVANNFIWGFLLLPVTQLGELIKQEVSTKENAVEENTPGYFAVTAIICGVWCLTIPLWKPFMSTVLGYSDVDKLFDLVLVLLGFYVLYAFQNVFDATFYGLGKTNYMLFESVVTNSVYYGVAFILYQKGIWVPSLLGIALLFGIGMAFDSVVSFGAYLYMRKKRSRNKQ